ncbi:RPAP1-like protein [Chaetomium strumarium]|uniref:RPAP1-like protein n=1 Tax=Chaetomium strumarium TaxID=1170767 RepID=A0AAJ0M1Q1_9PEZI|nr:RPAP1-like protein [Chaetomium strumarium]
MLAPPKLVRWPDCLQGQRHLRNSSTSWLALFYCNHYHIPGVCKMEVTLHVNDIQEKYDVKPPSSIISPPSGPDFPVQKTRLSAFKRRLQGKPAGTSSVRTTSSTSSTVSDPKSSSRNGAPSRRDTGMDERRGIDEETDAVLSSMSPEQITEAQKELYNGLDPKFLRMLLKRANLDEPTDPSPFRTASSEASPSADSPPTSKSRHITVEDEPEEPPEVAPGPVPEPDEGKPSGKPKKSVTFHFDEDAPPPIEAIDLFPVTEAPKAVSKANASKLKAGNNNAPQDVTNNTHFPRPPRVPDLDPSDPDFLETMHKKFFPNLPADPSKLAWMAPIPTPGSTADQESPYYPGQDSLPVSALRFDFRGALLPPRVSRAIPVTKGLHHHGEAPEAAGYTIPELAKLARSAMPAQRCLAYQTLGRMLYRLGRGEWGPGAGGRNGEEDDLAFSLWRCFQEGRVLESLEAEASLPEGKGHLSSKAYATEALWLFEKGGWRERWRGR